MVSNLQGEILHFDDSMASSSEQPAIIDTFNKVLETPDEGLVQRLKLVYFGFSIRYMYSSSIFQQIGRSR
jgi:hypothetical protein